MIDPVDDMPGAQYGRGRETGVLERLDVPIGLGALRLSADGRPPEAAAAGCLLKSTADHGIPFLAHRPIGGHAKVHQIANRKILKPLAERHQATPHQIALTTLLDSGPHLPPWLARLEAKVSCRPLRTTISGEHYPRSPDDQRLLPGRTEALQSWVDEGFQLFFVSNQSGVATKRLTLPTMQACFLQTAQLLNLPVTEICYCPHPAHPIRCLCRKPLPGLGVYVMERHQLALDQLVMVGDTKTDARFAANLGCTYYNVDDFFA